MQHTDNVQPMTYDPEMNGLFTCEELKRVVKRAKCKKAPGFDEIRVDFLKNENACLFLVKFLIYVFQWERCHRSGQSAC